MKQLKSFENTIEYHELIMTLDNLNNSLNYQLLNDYNFVFYRNENDIKDWIKIHISTGEFNSIKEAKDTFYNFYSPFLNELNKRLVFIVDKNGNKIATATLSPNNEVDYPCVIDWLGVSKDYQGKKLSKPLLTKIVDIAKNLGYNKILLHTQTNSWLAAKIYLDFGFEPKNIDEIKGWQILKTITNHTKLENFSSMPNEEIFDDLIINIKQSLGKIYNDFEFNVWYANGRNDVYVRVKNDFFEYKFYDNGKRLEKVK